LGWADLKKKAGDGISIPPDELPVFDIKSPKSLREEGGVMGRKKPLHPVWVTQKMTGGKPLEETLTRLLLRKCDIHKSHGRTTKRAGGAGQGLKIGRVGNNKESEKRANAPELSIVSREWQRNARERSDLGRGPHHHSQRKKGGVETAGRAGTGMGG